MTVREVLSRFESPRKQGDGWMVRCPAHDDHNPSLRISEGDDGRILLKCFSGCSAESIVAAKNLAMADLFPERKAEPWYEFERAYDYCDESGTLLFQVVRKRLANPDECPNEKSKKFIQRRPDGAGGWIWNLKDVRRVLYRLPELLDADLNEPVFLPEGEKDVDRLRACGLVSTCNPMGAGDAKNNFNWRSEYNESLRGRFVVILPDNDQLGGDHANAKARALVGIAASVKMLPLSELSNKGDVSDWLDASHNVEELRELAAAAPEWTPEAKETGLSAEKEQPHTQAQEDEGLTLSQLLVQLVRENAELFHDAGGDAYLTATVGEHRENYRMGSRDSKDWLAGLLYRKTGRVASGDKITEALTVLRAIARHDSPEIETHVRVAGHDNAIYLDLCDKNWGQVEIAKDGWRLIESKDSPVRFVRAKGMLPLPEPARGGSIDELRELLNLPVDDADNWPMILGWLVAALRPCNNEGFDYPLLAIHGEQGSAKSSAQRILRDLIDPNKATLRSAPRDERDLAIAAAHGRIISCDNLTHISENLSNAFCRLATGGGFATRELFTDDGEVIFDAQRPVILNGIAEVVTKSDLLDRTLLTQLPVIEAKRRWRKRILNRKFADARPRVLGALLDAASSGLKRLGEGVELDEWPRMADFAEWVIACEKALGLEDGAFIAAYRRNVRRANDLAIDSSLVAQAIIALIDESADHKFEGTVKELLETLGAGTGTNSQMPKNETTDQSPKNETNSQMPKNKTGQTPKNKKDWLTTPEQLRADLVKLAPNLRREKIEVSWGKRTRRGRQLTIARLVPDQPSQPSHRHQTNEINNLNGDGLCDGLDFGEFGTVTGTLGPNGVRAACDGSQSDGKGDCHTDRHTVNHSKQKTGDGVTVVTVTPEHDDPAPTHRRKVTI